ncbi:MAG TPA: hypothetical protein VKV35_05605 [Streptosporangiaceae bacterium]|jgi:hypothetical protein|nr:hypothetical protein [Streptosporangiaceae bacterium]
MATDTMRRTPRSPAPPRPRPRPVSSPRHTRPVTGTGRRPAPGAQRRPAPRTPFIVLIVGLLGGAMISLLVISTTLAQGSFQIANLQQQDATLARQEQVLSQQVAQAESPARIAAEATQLGMRQNPQLAFINPKTGKIISGKVSSADAQIHVPGYTP